VKALFNKFITLAFRWHYRRMNRQAWETHPLPDVQVGSIQLPLGDLTFSARMYHGLPSRPLIIYFHGGGWTIGDLDTHHPFCMTLAHGGAVDY
jgi:acetyl esterase